MRDTYGREISYLRLSVTDRCNLRCRYCMPRDGICKKQPGDLLTEEEMILAVRAAVGLGVRKLRITGGEPLVKKNLLSICERAAAVPGIEELCLTTNATLLPGCARQLRSAGVRRINLSLDTLDARKYAHMTRVGQLQDALDGLHAALEAGFEKVKVNVVLIGGFNEEEIPALAQLTQRDPLDVRFIELMPTSQACGFPGEAFISCDRVLQALPQAEAVAGDGGVAQLYRLPGAQGNLGLIRPLSAHFCAACSRIRLTADGRIKPCLHSAAEFSIKGMDLQQMQRQFERAILAKPAGHGGLSARCPSRAERDMNQIGG